MISTLVLISTLASTAFAVVGSAPTSVVGSAAGPSNYIVVFKDSRTSASSQARELSASLGRVGSSAPRVGTTVSFSGFKAVTVSWDDKNALDLLKSHQSTLIVEKEGFAKVSAVQKDAPWGLGRVDQRNAVSQFATRFQYNYDNNAGFRSTAWVIDTGLDDTNPQFGGRAKLVKNYDPDSVTKDDHGHGTHVAGTIGSARYGVAKRVAIRGIRVCNKEGSCPWSWIISGIQDVVTAYQAKGSTRITDVINMSLGGDVSESLNAAVQAATQAGVVFVAAAGNEEDDACFYSPSSAPSALTVAASDITDTIASFSNRGSCVDIFAPGVQILSTLPNQQLDYWSGTSMAAPHVAGAVALVLTTRRFTSVETVNQAVINKATLWKIKGPINATTSDTPNRVLFTL